MLQTKDCKVLTDQQINTLKKAIIAVLEEGKQKRDALIANVMAKTNIIAHRGDEYLMTFSVIDCLIAEGIVTESKHSYCKLTTPVYQQQPIAKNPTLKVKVATTYINSSLWLYGEKFDVYSFNIENEPVPWVKTCELIAWLKVVHPDLKVETTWI